MWHLFHSWTSFHPVFFGPFTWTPEFVIGWDTGSWSNGRALVNSLIDSLVSVIAFIGEYPDFFDLELVVSISMNGGSASIWDVCCYAIRLLL